MEVNIQNAQQAVIKFFGGSYPSYEPLFPLCRFINTHSLLMCDLGHIEINQKHKGTFGFIAAVNKDESEMIIFITNRDYHPQGNNGFDAAKDEISMFCVKDNLIYEYRNSKGKIWVSDFNSYTGLNMITVAKKFHENVIESDLHISSNELIFDIINHERKNK